MARYKPGNSGNPGGRPAGSKNKLRAPLKEELREWLSDTWPQIKRDVKAMKPEDRVRIWEKILAYDLPRPKDPLEVNMDIRHLTEDQVDSLLDRILERKV